MLYPNLKFPRVSGRPFFYTNFVETIDGKVAVKRPGYWPIGSKTDYQILTELRAHADCLIHGKNLGLEFGEITLKNLIRNDFKAKRLKLGKNPLLPYYIITQKRTGANVNHLEGGLASHLLSGSIKQLVGKLHGKGYKHVLVEGGPTLLGSFLKENLIDEIFLTIAPKIYGAESGTTITLVEGILFKPAEIKKLKLVSVKKVEDELYLRYRLYGLLDNFKTKRSSSL